MKRLTTNAPKDNIETALNLFYIKDHETWVRGGGPEPDYPDVSLFDFTRALIKAHLPDVKVPEHDSDFSAMMAEWLFDDVDSKEGTIATLYTAAWAFAELREKLMRYEDAGMVPGEMGHCEACDYWRENDPRCMNEHSQWAGMAVKKDNYCGGFEKRAAQAGWISIKERLPEPFVSVLVYMPDERPLPTVHEGYIAPDGKWYAHFSNRGPGEVAHWMPMPEPSEGT